MENKLKTKDFISVGIFAAVYVVGYMILVTVLGFVPALYFFSAAVGALVLAPIYFLFVARVPKNYAVSLLVAIIGLVFALMMPAYWPIYAFALGSALLAELFARRAKFKKFSYLMLSYVAFCFWSLGIFTSFWVYTDGFIARTESYGYEASYVESMKALIQPGVLVAIYVATIVAAVIGSYFAKKLLNKHFKKAGIA